MHTQSDAPRFPYYIIHLTYIEKPGQFLLVVWSSIFRLIVVILILYGVTKILFRVLIHNCSLLDCSINKQTIPILIVWLHNVPQVHLTRAVLHVWYYLTMSMLCLPYISFMHKHTCNIHEIRKLWLKHFQCKWCTQIKLITCCSLNWYNRLITIFSAAFKIVLAKKLNIYFRANHILTILSIIIIIFKFWTHNLLQKKMWIKYA